MYSTYSANTALVRNNNIGATTFNPKFRFNALAQNLSPRIARVGLVIGF